MTNASAEGIGTAGLPAAGLGSVVWSGSLT